MPDVSPDFTFANGTTADADQVQDVIDEIVAGVNDRIEKVRTGISLLVTGEVRVPSGNADVIPPFYVPVIAGSTVKLVAVRAKIGAGTSVTYKVQRNGADVAGFTGLVADPDGEAADPADVTLADGDLLQVIATAVAGTPQNLTVTLILEHASA